jgi:muramoyltetrapeptide carboxypeptidase
MNHFDRRKFLKTTGLSATSLFLGGPFFDVNAGSSSNSNKPALLKPGDTVAVTAPANGVFRKNAVSQFKARLNRLGFKVELGKTLYEYHGNMAGPDDLRASELMQYFTDEQIKGIFTMRGGWGCGRILPMLDFDRIKQNPKVIIGFSDITSLLIAIYAKTGMITFHGPVGYRYWNAFTTSSFKKVLMQKSESLQLSNASNDRYKVKTINSGKARGKLIGGNLTVVSSMIGTAYTPDWEGKILFLEDIGEEPYRIDRMLTQLRLSGVFDKINGFIFGQCAACLPPIQSQSFTLLDVLQQHMKPLNIPAYMGASIGHIENKMTLPIGVNAELDADKGKITLLETAIL